MNIHLQTHETKPFVKTPTHRFHDTRHTKHCFSFSRKCIAPTLTKHQLSSPACNESLQQASSSFLFFVDLVGFLLSA
jgi:hypothetical protein